MNPKPILLVDFDGVIHSYETVWSGADVIPDPPVPGAMKFLIDATDQFRVCIYSSRTNQAGGVDAMHKWLHKALSDHFKFDGNLLEVAEDLAIEYLALIEFPTEKPPAMVSLDDRAVQFTGKFPDISELRAFKPWNRKKTTRA